MFIAGKGHCLFGSHSQVTQLDCTMIDTMVKGTNSEMLASVSCLGTLSVNLKVHD